MHPAFNRLGEAIGAYKTEDSTTWVVPVGSTYGCLTMGDLRAIWEQVGVVLADPRSAADVLPYVEAERDRLKAEVARLTEDLDVQRQCVVQDAEEITALRAALGEIRKDVSGARQILAHHDCEDPS